MLFRSRDIKFQIFGPSDLNVSKPYFTVLGFDCYRNSCLKRVSADTFSMLAFGCIPKILLVKEGATPLKTLYISIAKDWRFR